MSEMEYFSGKIKPIFPEGNSFEEKIKWFEKHGHIIHEWDENYLDCDTILLLNDNDFYEIITLNINRENVFSMSEQDGEMYISGSYYNGGCCLEEYLEEEIPAWRKKNKKNENNS